PRATDALSPSGSARRSGIETTGCSVPADGQSQLLPPTEVTVDIRNRSAAGTPDGGCGNVGPWPVAAINEQFLVARARHVVQTSAHLGEGHVHGTRDVTGSVLLLAAHIKNP